MTDASRHTVARVVKRSLLTKICSKNNSQSIFKLKGAICMKRRFNAFVALLLIVCSLSGCSGIECNATILKDGFSINDEWLESNYTRGSYQSDYNNELPESRMYVIKNQGEAEAVFTDTPKIDFDTEMLIVYLYTTIYMRKQRLDRVTFDGGALSIEFDVVDGRIGAGDACVPQTRACVIRLHKLEADEIIITYKGQ